MAETWLLFFVVLVCCLAAVAWTVGQRARSQQLEAGRFRMLTQRMRDLDAALADFEADFATRFGATGDRAVTEANAAMDGVQAQSGESGKASRASVAAATKLVGILATVKKNYEDLEALASRLSAGERERLYRVSETMKARHAELASRIKDDGLTQLLDAMPQ